MTNDPHTSAPPNQPMHGNRPSNPPPPYKSPVQAELEHFDAVKDNPANRPRLDFWFGRSIWSAQVAAALILEVEPYNVRPLSSAILQMKPDLGRAATVYAELVRRFEFAVRAGNLPEHFTPAQALDFAVANNFVPIPTSLTDRLTTSEKQQKVLESKDANPTSTTKQLNSLLMIIAGLIQVAYKPNSETKRGALISEIMRDMELAGQDMSRDTLKKYVDKALDEFAPGSTSPNSD